MRSTALLFVAIFLSLQSYSQLNAPGILWSKCFGGAADEKAYGIIAHRDGGFVICGYASSWGSTAGDVPSVHCCLSNGGYGADAWVVKIDANGNKQWSKALGGNRSEYFYSIANTFDGGFICIGSAASNDGDVTQHFGAFPNYQEIPDVWVVKFSAAGTVEWKKSYGGSQQMWECLSGKQPTAGMFL